MEKKKGTKDSKKLRKIDHKYFKVGALWYYKRWLSPSSPVSGVYQIIAKQSYGIRYFQKIYPDPLTYTVTDSTNNNMIRDFTCKRILQPDSKSFLRPLYGPNDEKGATLRLLYGKPVKTKPRKPGRGL